MLMTMFTLRAQTEALDPDKALALESKLNEYFAAIETLPVEDKIKECDFLIESCDDEAVRQHVALYIYAHYLTPTIMGEEAVAVHMVDDWFTPGKIKMVDDYDLINAKVYAQFTRNSLVGKPAPVLDLYDRDNNVVTLPSEGKLSVLFFYDVACAKCKLQTLLLRSLLSDIDYPLDFFAVYSGANRSEWDKYIEERWDIKTDAVTIHHLWDPEIDSNFQVEYGVLETPQMLLVDASGKIVGRKLDAEALKQLLDIYKPYAYGNDSSMSFFSELFASEPSAAEILEAASYLKTRTLEAQDSLLCKHLMGDFLYYLMDSQDEEAKLALLPFIKIHIEDQPGLWADPDDQKAVVMPSQVAKDLLSRVPIGSRIPAIKLKASVKSAAQKGLELADLPVKNVRLRALKGNPGYLVFYSKGCSSCKEAVAAADAILESDTGAKFLFIEPTMDLLDVFDLSVLPHIIELDKKGNVVRKYIQLKQNDR